MSMEYTPTTWKNGETPINEKNLNNMENGIVNAANIASIAENSAKEAATSATNASNSATAATASANVASEKATVAANSAASATASATTASNKATAATNSATTAENKAAAAAISEANAKTSETNAADSAIEAATSAASADIFSQSASGYADTASEKAAEASASADSVRDTANQSKSYAVGGTGTRENEDSDNAKYYYEQTKQISQGINGIVPMGTVTFANLPTSDIVKNAMYNVSDAFVSDERFNDGGGVSYGPGNNVIWTAEGFWDVTASSSVTGVKGEAEDTYRQGNVNITKESIGVGDYGTENISDIADGTVKGAIRELADNPADASVWLSQAEYDALSEEEKMDGRVYRVYDVDVYGNAYTMPFTSELYEAKNTGDALVEVKNELATTEESLDGYIFVSKSGNHVTLFSSDRASGKTYVIGAFALLKIGTLPEEYRPKRDMQFITHVRNTTSGAIYLVTVFVDTDGSVYLYNTATNSEIKFSQKGFSFGWDV